jgi:hypothetical protein
MFDLDHQKPFRLTKKKVIELTIELWKWVYENKSHDKRAWPEWDKYGYVKNECFCCEYADRKPHAFGDMDCEDYCPLYKLWPHGAGYSDGRLIIVPCQSNNSSFERWVEGDIEGAKELYEGAEEILKNKDY